MYGYDEVHYIYLALISPENRLLSSLYLLFDKCNQHHLLYFEQSPFSSAKWRDNISFIVLNHLWLDIVPSNHPIQFPGKLTSQTSENGKKPNFGCNFGPFGPNLGLTILFMWIFLS